MMMATATSIPNFISVIHQIVSYIFYSFFVILCSVLTNSTFSWLIKSKPNRISTQFLSLSFSHSPQNDSVSREMLHYI